MPHTEWLQTHCRKLFLQGLVVNAWIGVHDFEKHAPQRVRVDVEVFVRLEDSQAQADHITEVVDYDFIRQVILQRVAAGAIELQETLCDDVLKRILAHQQVVAAQVRTCKLDVYPDCAGVGVEVFQFKDQGHTHHG
jgi:7,8-dihydroneopterin aldolase/epimerase/oxygenase